MDAHSRDRNMLHKLGRARRENVASDIHFYFIICFVMFGYLSADITIEAKDGIGFCFMETKGGAFSMEMKKVNGRIRFIQKLYGKCTTY